MTNSKNTKRALTYSMLALFLCVAMLIGTTFAWFTDTASTGVNRIQAGRLDVDIVDKDGNSLDGEALSFRNVNGSADILWEPGATFNLDSFKIVNKGNLALKYKVTINGFDGDNKLMEAIDFTVKKGGAAESVALEDWEGVLLPAGKTDAKTGEEVGETGLVTISGKMRTDAGNEYQGLSLNGISITVVATQYTYENDSFGNTYDANAAYPAVVSNIKAEYGTDGLKMPSGVEITDNGSSTDSFTITLKDKEAFLYFTQVFDRAAAFEARKAGLEAGTITKYPSEYNLSSLNMWYGSYCSRITVKMGCDVDLSGINVKPFGLSGYAFNFDGNGHTIRNAKVQSASGDTGFFQSRTIVRNVVLDNIHVIATGCDSAGVVAGAPNANIDGITVKNCSVTGAKYTGAVAGYDYGDITNCIVEDTVVSGQYKVGGIVGYVCTDNAEQQRTITGNKLTNVTVKGENLWKDKDSFVIGKIVGNWNAKKGTCTNNTFTGTTTATDDIGKIESGCTVQQ